MKKYIYLLLISFTLTICGCATTQTVQPLTQEQAFEQLKSENQKLTKQYQKLTKQYQKNTKTIKSLTRQRNTLCLIFLLELLGGLGYAYSKNDKVKSFINKLAEKVGQLFKKKSK